MSEGESAAGAVKEAFSGTRGKVLIIGGSALVVYLWWTRGRNGTPEPAPDELVPVPATGRTPQTDPTVGNDSQGSIVPRKPATPEEWLSSGVDLLMGRGVPGTSASSALSKALASSPVTTQETAWINQVVQALGSPPGGMPPLVAAPPTTGGQANTSKPATPGGLHVTGIGWYEVRLSWNLSPGATAYEVLRQPGNVTIRKGITSIAVVNPLFKNTTYRFAVRAINANGASAWSSYVTAKTKK